MVVERGRARCPRCVATAEYTFVEYEPNGVRYEVRCRKCGECYAEDLRPPVPGTALAVIEPPLRWPPDLEPVPPRDVRAEVLAHLTSAREHALAGAGLVSLRAQAWRCTAQTWAMEKWALEKQALMQWRGLAVDQTGG
jgi:hypothetical protein